MNRRGEGYYVSGELPGYWNTGMLSGLFDRNRDIRSEFHTHREEGLISHQILFTMSGKGKIIVGDKEYTAGKGSIFYVASGEPHTYYPIDGDWRTYWVVFRGDSLDAMMARLGFDVML